MRVAAMVSTGFRIVFAFLDTRDCAVSRTARTQRATATDSDHHPRVRRAASA
jgi:hypothetical protein